MHSKEPTETKPITERLHCAAKLAAVALLLNFSLVHAEIRPANPTNFDHVFFSVPSALLTDNPYWCERAIARDATSVEFKDGKLVINITIDHEHAVYVLAPPDPCDDYTVPIGKLPAGDYSYELYVHQLGQPASDSPADIGDFHVVPAPLRSPYAAVSDLNGLWTSPQRRGEGLILAQLASGQLGGYWLGYKDDGSPVWYMLASGSWIEPGTWQGKIYAVDGYDSFDPAVVPQPSPNVSEVGSVTLSTFLGYFPFQFGMRAYINGAEIWRGWTRARL